MMAIVAFRAQRALVTAGETIDPQRDMSQFAPPEITAAADRYWQTIRSLGTDRDRYVKPQSLEANRAYFRAWDEHATDELTTRCTTIEKERIADLQPIRRER